MKLFTNTFGLGEKRRPFHVDLEPFSGSCDHPLNKGKPMISLPDGFKENRKTMELLIHEALHASNWHASEELVAQTAEDVARMLWKLYGPR